MYHHQHTGTTGSHPKRRKKRPIHGIKSVEVTRGRSGYGFTISGQHPCVLSVIVPGSPAEIAGLKTGDYLVSVNNENVTKAAHDDVVRMVGMSTGTLSLQVAENYNSSDSSDDEYQHRTKARYPNRVRSRHATGSTRHNDKVLGECNQRDRHQSSSEYKHKDPYSARQDIPSKSGTSRSRLNAPVGAENSLPEVNSGQKVSQLSAPLSMERKGPLQPNSVFSTPAMHHPLAKQAVVKSTTQSARSARPGAVGIQGNLEVNRHNRTDASSSLQNSNVTPGISSFLKTSAHHSHSANNAFIMMEEDEDVDGDDEESLLNCSFHDTRVVVGYIGSIEMPSDANKPHIRLQSIRSAVRRLRIEQKIHTLVLMDVSQDGVKLTNAMGTTVAHYPVDRLAFSGVCPDDKRFFGIVTLHCSNTDDSSEENGSQDEEASSSGSCHVFMVDPEMKAHNIHAQKAKTFGINCTPTQDRHQCSEFPRSATSIIVAITNLYKDRPGGISNDNEVALSQAFADPSRAPQRSASNSSNSDSGLGFGKDDPSHDNVYVVDMPQARDVHQQPPRRAQNSFQAPGEPMQSHVSPGVQTMPAPMQGNQGVLSASCNIKPKPNRSASIDDISFMTPNEKFSIRAMPDSAHSLNMHADVLDKQNSAENLRASMQRLLQARDNHKVDQAPSSDQESNSSKNSDIFRSFSHPELQHSISAPFRQLSDDSSFSNAKKDSSKYEAVDIDNKKLSPRAFLPPFHQLRSPSAPPTVSRRADSDSDGDVDFSLGNASGMGSLIERFEHDHALRISSPANVSRRFSEGFALNTQREKDKVLEDGEKWSKPSTVRHRRLSRLQQPLSHSHESLVQLEHEVSNQRLSSVGSVNNITSHGSDNELKEEDIGRIAGWSVNFFKLLQDNGGLAVFTEFLKKEFSQENIIFWRTVEQYKKIDDSDKRKAKAKEIFTKHMSPKAADPINIEQSNRQLVEKQLDNPSSTTFDKPQLEIFKLMKQDSYPRFLKSELYKVYLMREMEGKPLNLPKDEFEEGQGKSKKEDKKKNKSKETEEKDKEKRRRSLLPWRQRNSKQNLKTTSDSEIKKHKEKEKEKMSTSTSSVSKEVNNNNTQKKSASGPGIDLSTMRKEVQANLKESKDKEVEEKNMKFCRVILPDGSTTVVCTKPGQSIRTVLGRLCEKRGLSIAAVDVFLLGSDKPLDLGEDVSSLGSKEVIIERRVLFRMDLPNRKSIGVKAKPNRTVRDVFKPILNKYGFKLDSITVQLSGQMGYVDIDEQVSTIDNQRIVILPTDGVQAKDGSPSTSKRPPPVVKYPPDFHVNSQTDSTSLDMITNRIFEDLMKGKSSKMAHNFDELGILDPELKTKVQLRGSDEHRSLGLFGLLRKESAYGKPAQDRTKMKTKNKVTFDLQRNETRRTEKYPEDDNFFDLLSKVQSDRYEDQRGLGTRASDIPAFLHKKMPHPSGRESAPPIMKQDHSRSESENMFTDIADYVKNDNDKFASYTRGHVSGRPASVPADSVRLAEESSDHIAYENNSFSADGVYPSTEEAENVFQSTAPDSADFDDPCLAEKGLRDIGFDYNYNMYQAKAWGYSRHRPNMSSRSSHSHSGINSPVRGPDRYSFEESSIYQTSEEDQDKTIVNSPVRQARPHSVPPVFGSELNAPISPITPTNSVKSSNSDRVQNNSFNEIGAGVEHSTPKSGQNSTQVPNHKSAFHSPSLKQNSQKESNNKNDKECLNTPDKVMVVHVTDDEESVTFV